MRSGASGGDVGEAYRWIATVCARDAGDDEPECVRAAIVA